MLGKIYSLVGTDSLSLTYHTPQHTHSSTQNTRKQPSWVHPYVPYTLTLNPIPLKEIFSHFGIAAPLEHPPPPYPLLTLHTHSSPPITPTHLPHPPPDPHPPPKPTP